MEQRTGLLLSGGGARAAYQVGALLAIAKLWGRRPGNPFQIICGTSAGAINAVALACYGARFRLGVRHLARVWRNFHVDQVFEADTRAVLGSVGRWGSAILFGALVRQNPLSLLNNAPLRALLERELDFSALAQALQAGDLRAVAVTASGYSSGENLAFYQGAPDLEPWRRAQRVGVPSMLAVDHLLASSAIPFVFPAVRIHREYFGDGSMRQMAPISPVIHLGAERILVISGGRIQEKPRARGEAYPSMAQVAGHALSSIFLDGLAMDLERLQRINATLGAFSPEARAQAGLTLKPIQTLVLAPSRSLDDLAAMHHRALPRALGFVLRSIGATRRNGSALLSYLLFESVYTRALMDLGYRDALTRTEELASFLGLEA